VFGKNINENPEKYFTPDILAMLEVAAKKEFSYGGGHDEAVDETVIDDNEAVDMEQSEESV
jgi:hypothetical protein